MKTITKTSQFTGAENTMVLDVTDAQLARWQGGELIQNVFPNLTDDEREFLITGATPEEWDIMFGDEDNYDDDDDLPWETTYASNYLDDWSDPAF